MKKIFFALMAMLIADLALGAVVSGKFLIPKDAAGCALDSDDTVNHIHGKPIAVVGIITTGGCFDGWTSGVNFLKAWEAVRLGKTAKTCDKKTDLQSAVDLSPGRKGFLENFSAIGDCTHTNGVVYTKYTADYET